MKIVFNVNRIFSVAHGLLIHSKPISQKRYLNFCNIANKSIILLKKVEPVLTGSVIIAILACSHIL